MCLFEYGLLISPVCRMAADFLKKDYLFLAVGVVGGACSDVEQKLVQVTKFSKKDQLLDILKNTGTDGSRDGSWYGQASPVLT